MTQVATAADVHRFRAAICNRLGLLFDDSKLGLVGDVLQARLSAAGASGDAYLAALEAKRDEKEIAALARALTVAETYFFRNIEQFRALAEVVIPERMRVRGASRTLRFLSAGCATGEEPYSMAIVCRETIADPSWDVSIRAVDLNPACLDRAKRAHYSSWALRDTPIEIQEKWFFNDGREKVLKDTVRAGVQFQPANLVEEHLELWRPGTYDAIFCRNVLMYFSPEQMRATIARVARALAPGGFLFLGHAETLRGISDRFHLRHTHGTFYYELADRAEQRDEVPPSLTSRSFPAPMPEIPMDDSWVDAIRVATERVLRLVPAAGSREPASLKMASSWDRAPALDLLRRERFAEALSYVRARPATDATDPDVLLLEATLLAHDGQLLAAEDACLKLLLVDELNAGAHYVLALCREHLGHVHRAIEHDRVASYLDPTFAMPRLHIGLLSSRVGDRAAARRELQQALDLLKREDASRLLLFGGGFGREALMSLCEAALREVGGGS